MTFFWAARIIDAWLGLRRAAATAWRVLPGDLMASVVIRSCGIPPVGREVRVGGTSAILVEHPAAAHYLDHQWIPVHAQTLGRYVFARETLADRTIAHELEHIRQWQRLGPLFLPAYVVSSGLARLRGQDPYMANAYEIAARRRELEPQEPVESLAGPVGIPD